MEVGLLANVGWSGSDWAALKQWLVEKRSVKTRMLVAEDDENKAQQLRGAIRMIEEVLRLEPPAA